MAPAGASVIIQIEKLLQCPGPTRLYLESFKRQVSSTKLCKCQATSFKPRITSIKLQAGSNKLPDPGTTVHEISIRGPRTKGLYNDKGIVRMS